MDAPNRSLIAFLSAARDGNLAALGQLLEAIRPDLVVLVRREIDRELVAKHSISDVVQQTLLEACEQFASFVGETPEQFRAWLRRILMNNLADVEKGFHRQRREAGREVPIGEAEADNGPLVAGGPSPSSCARHNERDALLEQAIHRLGGTARDVILLRNRDRLEFETIATQLNLPSADAARKQWFRAVERLRDILGTRHG